MRIIRLTFMVAMTAAALVFGGCRTAAPTVPSGDVGPVTPVNPQYEQSKQGEPQLPAFTPWWKFEN